FLLLFTHSVVCSWCAALLLVWGWFFARRSPFGALAVALLEPAAPGGAAACSAAVALAGCGVRG
ncbi:hypothetical protein ACFDR9_001663, partial [Janthinobacterium sp. CG_23.3]|uniref:hypothetical protein n=1 Tax=Janthinobacterium sp. CG_23.3 TaxID=3349634 RepID=UPI0038D42BFF